MLLALASHPSLTLRLAQAFNSILTFSASSSIPPKYAVAQVVGFIKGKSAIHLARVPQIVQGAGALAELGATLAGLNVSRVHVSVDQLVEYVALFK